MVMEVGDHDVTSRGHGRVMRSGQLILARTSFPEFEQQLAVGLEYEHARGLVVHHDEVTRRVQRDPFGALQFSVPDPVDELAQRVENAHALVVVVRDGDVAVEQEAGSGRALHLSRSATPRAELEPEFAPGAETCHALIVGVRDQDPAVGRNRDALRVGELTLIPAPAAHFEQQVVLGRVQSGADALIGGSGGARRVH